MHDIDRTQRESEMEAEHEHEYEGEHEHEQEAEAMLGSLFREAEHETNGEHEYEAEAETDGESESESEAEYETEAESPLSASQEMELASELLEVSNEAELEYFFGKLARMAARGVRGFVRSPVAKVLGRVVKGVAKKALPIAGSALGGMIGGPVGAKLGGGLGKLATNLFELELEGLSHEDREYEVARQVVRLGAAAVNRAARAPRGAPPQQIARRAFTSAARVYAPGLLRRRAPCRTCAARRRGASHVRRTNGSTWTSGTEPANADPSAAGYAMGDYPGSSRAGRWYRRGRKIVLTGL